MLEAAGFDALEDLSRELHLIRLPPGSPLAGATLEEARVGELVGLPVAAIVRDGRTLTPPPTDTTLQAGDGLLVVAPPARIQTLRQLGEVKLEPAAEESLEGRDIALVEAAVAPRSVAVGRTLRELSFRDRYGMVVLYIWRQG